MTYRDLLTDIQMAIKVLSQGITDPVEWEGAQTTKVRYATKKNRDRLQSEMETYQEMVSELAEDHQTEEDEIFALIRAQLNGGVEEPEEALVSDIDSILNQETSFEPYKVSEEALMEEENVPLAVLDLIDWMVE